MPLTEMTDENAAALAKAMKEFGLAVRQNDKIKGTFERVPFLSVENCEKLYNGGKKNGQSNHAWL